MSIKIKVSYNTEEELQKVMQLLGTAVKEYKISGNKKGLYRKAYIDLRK